MYSDGVFLSQARSERWQKTHTSFDWTRVWNYVEKLKGKNCVCIIIFIDRRKRHITENIFL